MSAAPDPAVQRVLSTRHAKLLLKDERTVAKVASEIRRRSGGRWRRVAGLAGKAALLWALLHVSTVLLFGHYPALWHLLQNTEAYSRAELQYNLWLRRVTVGLRLHGSELLHRREREQCLLPNPLYRPPLLCCPCNRHRVVTARSADAILAGFEGLFDRMVGPFAYANNSQPAVAFPQLSAAVATAWEAVSLGSNRLRVLWPPEAAGNEATPMNLKTLFRFDSRASAAPPAGQAITWLFGHLPAIRALRDLVRRPDHIPALAEDTLARQFVFLGAGIPADEWIALGDLGVVKGLAHAFAPHGEVTVRLALKPQCCPAEVAGVSYSDEVRRLGPGDVLGFLTDCYWVSVARQRDDYAILYFGSVYNGLHPIDTSAARKTPAERDKLSS